VSEIHNIIICGGRVGRNLTKKRVYAVLDHMSKSWPTPFRIVQGKAAWVDEWGGQWALDRGHPMQPVPIDERFDDGRDAPKQRNIRMADHFPPYMCVGFPGGGGTFHMMEHCHDLGVPVADVEIDFDGSFQVHWWPQG
jgi:hypothetical protein